LRTSHRTPLKRGYRSNRPALHHEQGFVHRSGTHTGRCPNLNGQPAYGTSSKVVLTSAHLDRTPELRPCR
jgi:hypothetical protein